MIDAKKLFQDEPECKEFADIISRRAFRKGCAFAFAELMASVRSDEFTACRLEGARLMLDMLEHIVAPDKTARPAIKTLKPTQTPPPT